MTVNTSEFVNSLLALKAQYEHSLTEAGTKATHYKEQIAHINALLLDRILPAQTTDALQAHLEQSEPLLVLTPQDDEGEQPSLPAAKASAPSKKSTAKARPALSDQAPGSRVSIPFLPAYQGLKKLEAISRVMADHAGQVLHQDTIIKELFGELNPAALKTERLRMKTALLQGVKKGFWKKAPKPSSYILKAAKAKAAMPSEAAVKAEPAPKPAPKASTAKPASRAKTKPAATKAPSKTSTPKTKVGAPGKTSAPRATTPKVKAPKVKATREKGQSPRIILPMKSEFSGLSKIDAVLKVMEENAGKPVHIETIIERLFGKLSGAESKAEKGRMKDVMNRGRDRKLWNKASAPLSFIVGAPSGGSGSKTVSGKTSGRASSTKAGAKSASKGKPISTRRRRGG